MNIIIMFFFVAEDEVSKESDFADFTDLGNNNEVGNGVGLGVTGADDSGARVAVVGATVEDVGVLVGLADELFVFLFIALFKRI